jgi:DNA-binding GntR family transcriptional regulator
MPLGLIPERRLRRSRRLPGMQLACERMEADDKARIVEAYEACQKAASAFDPEEYFSTNGDFHSSIHQASHNSMLIEQIEHLNKRLSPIDASSPSGPVAPRPR